MARSVNKVILIGNLGKDPELRYTTGGQAVARFSLATTDRWKDKNSGELQEKTEWHNIVCWARLAETVNQYLKKGQSAYVEGRLQTRQWEDKDQVKRYTTEIVANEVVMLGGGRGAEQGGGYRPAAAAASAPANGADEYAAEGHLPSTEITDDDIPF